jgi:hypothetical protein
MFPGRDANVFMGGSQRKEGGFRAFAALQQRYPVTVL